MDRKIILSASLICADLLNLERDLHVLSQNGFDYIHFDMMDGHFVSRIGLGTFFLEQVVKKQTVPVDVHLMVSDPTRYIDEIAEAGASIITFHYESGKDIYQVIGKKMKKIKCHNYIGKSILTHKQDLMKEQSIITKILKFIFKRSQRWQRSQKK